MKCFFGGGGGEGLLCVVPSLLKASGHFAHRFYPSHHSSVTQSFDQLIVCAPQTQFGFSFFPFQRLVIQFPMTLTVFTCCKYFSDVSLLSFLIFTETNSETLLFLFFFFRR